MSLPLAFLWFVKATGHVSQPLALAGGVVEWQSCVSGSMRGTGEVLAKFALFLLPRWALLETAARAYLQEPVATLCGNIVWVPTPVSMLHNAVSCSK